MNLIGLDGYKELSKLFHDFGYSLEVEPEYLLSFGNAGFTVLYHELPLILRDKLDAFAKENNITSPYYITEQEH